MTLQIEDDLTALLRTGEQTEEAAARELIVLELYRQHRISGGKAAELLGSDKTDFIRRASSLGIPWIDQTDDELQREIEAAESLMA